MNNQDPLQQRSAGLNDWGALFQVQKKAEASKKTSRQYQDMVKNGNKKTREQIRYRILRQLLTKPMTDDEVEEITGLPHQTVSACRRGLVKSGHVEPTGESRLTRSNRHAQTWQLTAEANILMEGTNE